MRSILFLSIFILADFAFGQNVKSKIEISEYMKDLTFTESDGQNLTMSIWMPMNYLELSAQNMPDYDPEIFDMIETWFSGYTLVMIYSGKMDIDKKMFVSESESTIRNKVSLEYNSKKYKPLPPNQLSDELAQLSAMLKPMMGQMFGSMGPGMNFFFFDVRDGKRNSMLDPYKDTDFKVNVDKEKFNYNLPVPSLFEDKECEKDGENYPSNYNYCPIHGNELK